MRTRSFHIIVTGVCVASVGATSLGQMTLISADRVVGANQYGYWPSQNDGTSTQEFGAWEASAMVTYAYASQTSNIQSSGVEFITSGYAPGGAGHHSASTNYVLLVFDIERPVSWSVHYDWDNVPLMNEYRALLRRVDSDLNFFAGANWFSRNNPVMTGTLDAGRYQLYFTATLADSSYSYQQRLAFNVSVPAPATLALLLITPMALRRSRGAE